MKQKKFELAANKAYSSLQTIFQSKQIHRNNKTIQNINQANTMLWKHNLDLNTSVRADAKHV